AVVGGGVGAGVWAAGASSTTCAGPAAATVSSPLRTCGGDEGGGADTCISASAGAPAMAAQSATGTARRAFLNPRVVRTPPLLENAGTARPRLGVEAHPATSQNWGEARRPLLWIANRANRTASLAIRGRRPGPCFPRSRPRSPPLKHLLRRRSSPRRPSPTPADWADPG